MELEFSIDSPLTPEAVAAARTSAEKVVKYRFLIMLLTLALAGYLSFSFWDVAISIVRGHMGVTTSVFLDGWLGGWVAFLICLMVFTGTISAVAMIMGPFTSTYARTSPLESWKAVHALDLAKQYPELEVYRQAVVSCRTFLEGDYEAMKAYADEARVKHEVRQEIDKHAAAVAALNAPTVAPKP